MKTLIVTIATLALLALSGCTSTTGIGWSDVGVEIGASPSGVGLQVETGALCYWDWFAKKAPMFCPDGPRDQGDEVKAEE